MKKGSVTQRTCVHLLLVASLFVASSQVLNASTAPDGPGALSHFDLARKDCLGTAENTSSIVWFTVASGVLSDVYYPTNDNTNVETMQYVVTDGSTFTDLQTRDTTYTVQALDSQALECRITATAKSGRYRIITDYLTDPAQNTVVMNVKFQPLVGDLSSYKLYVIYNPSINGNGGGGSGNGGGDYGTVDTSTGHNILIASDPNTATNAVNRTYATPVYSALDASPFFLQVTNGFVDQGSDPLVQTRLSSRHLHAGHTLMPSTVTLFRERRLTSPGAAISCLAPGLSATSQSAPWVRPNPPSLPRSTVCARPMRAPGMLMTPNSKFLLFI